MTQALFREEMLRARRQRWLGEVVLDQPLTVWTLTACVLLAAVVVGLLLAFGDYTRRTRVSGQLVPSEGVVLVASPIPGVLASLMVEEGQRVLAGQAVAVVSVPASTRRETSTPAAMAASISTRRQSLEVEFASQRDRLKSQLDGLERRKSLAHGEMVALEAEMETIRRQRELADQALQRFQVLRSQQFVTDLQVQQQEAQVLDLQAGAQSLERSRVAIRRQLAELEQAIAEMPAQQAQVEAAEASGKAALDQELVELGQRSEALVKAPIAGRVGTVYLQAGQAAQGGQALVALLPAASRLEAILMVPSSAIGLVAPGDVVVIRFPAFPYQKFGHQRGRVLRVSRTSLPPQEANPAPEPLYRVVVGLESQSVRASGRDIELKSGLGLEADILGERRRLWEWILEPMFGLRDRVATHVPEEVRH